MGDFFYRALQPVFSLFWPCKLLGRENIPARGPAVFVSNHLGSYAPVATLAHFPVRLYPWVEHQTTNWKLCPEYLRHDFVEQELHLRPPLSRLVAWSISKACVVLMKLIQAIPVYDRTMRMAATWKRSLKHLQQGRWLAVFPENDAAPWNDVIHRFDQGFVGLGPLYYEKTGQRLSFSPVAVHKTARAIKIGPPIAYDPTNPFSTERERITGDLQNRITEMFFMLGSSPA